MFLDILNVNCVEADTEFFYIVLFTYFIILSSRVEIVDQIFFEVICSEL